MEKIRLERTGQLDLEFEGKEVASASEYQSHGDRQNRYHMWTLYKTGSTVKSCEYVLQEVYVTRWQGEDGSSSLYTFADLEGVKDYFFEDREGVTILSDVVKEFLEDVGISVVETLE